MAQVGCPDRRIDRLCIRCCSPSQPSHHAMVLGAISSDPQRGWIIISLAPSHHCPGHSGELVGKRDGGDFGRPSCQQRCDPGPILGAVDLGIANDGESIVVIVCMTWLLRIVGALTAPTSMARTWGWREIPIIAGSVLAATSRGNTQGNARKPACALCDLDEDRQQGHADGHLRPHQAGKDATQRVV